MSAEKVYTRQECLAEIQKLDQKILALEATGNFNVLHPDCEEYIQNFLERDMWSARMFATPMSKYSLFAVA